jgi:hypothetical protein
MSWTSYVPSVPFQLGKAIYDKYKGSQQQDQANKNRQDQAFANLNQTAGYLGQTGAESNQFARSGQQGYGMMTGELGQDRQNLRDLASGRNSVSSEQLRQGLDQNLAAQRSMAASASPAEQAMAARTAMIQSGRLGAGMSGQAALAGLQERQGAMQQLSGLDLQQRQQDSNVALGSRGNAISAYGGAGSAYGQVAGNTGMNTDEARLKQLAGLTQGGLQAAAMFSDERLKEDVKGGDKDANRAIAALRAYTFKYKNEQHGKGKQVGVMAQDLEGAGLGHAVFETPAGKAVHGAKLSGANTAMIAALGRRVEELEKGRGK